MILAFDLGAEITGWAKFSGFELEAAGSWTLRTSRREHPGKRWARLRTMFRNIVAISGRPDFVAYEKVMMHASGVITCSACGTIKSYSGRGKSLRCGKCGKPARRRATMNVAAAHCYGATEAFLEEFCYEIGREPVTVHTSEVKKAATGKGGGLGTGKVAVLEAARARWPGIKFDNDNVADAAFVGLAAVTRDQNLPT